MKYKAPSSPPRSSSPGSMQEIMRQLGVLPQPGTTVRL